MELKNKVVLVTGGAIRVGRAIVDALVGAGANVYCHYFQSVREAENLKKIYPQISLIKIDLSRQGNAQQLISEVVSRAGTIDVLINNAAIFLRTPLGTVTEKTWDQLFDLNLKAGFFLAQQAGQIMKDKGSGKIINIADTCGLRPWPSYIPYAISKGAVISMTKGLAKALAPFVQVNSISPGPVLLPEDYGEADEKKAIEKTLLKSAGKAKDIAAAIRFLLEDGDYITGIDLAVDGGRSLGEF
ncbi:MAG: SDR family oxidoreductase [Calditrichales bacterium]|nr:MAG: SDR family oxidoreductase [Calditrichales bacterium]